jgi:hypothetical protein
MPDSEGVARRGDVVNAQNACAALCSQQGGGDAGGQSVSDWAGSDGAKHGLA